jgi:hypothetical protein
MKWQVLVAVALSLTASVLAQRTGTTTLALRVDPEARLNPSQIAMNFRVSAGGANDITTQTQTIEARVRALPGQPIRLTATASGTIPLSALRWSGSPAGAAGGGEQAACSSGTFETAATQDLVTGWSRSGTLTCTVTFSLADPASLPPGNYTGNIALAIR